MESIVVPKFSGVEKLPEKLKAADLAKEFAKALETGKLQKVVCIPESPDSGVLTMTLKPLGKGDRKTSVLGFCIGNEQVLFLQKFDQTGTLVRFEIVDKGEIQKFPHIPEDTRLGRVLKPVDPEIVTSATYNNGPIFRVFPHEGALKADQYPRYKSFSNVDGS
jgi:hypothetical protein